MSDCTCPDSIGGDLLICELDQVAFCGIINGRPIRRCLDVPATRNPKMLVNWALSEIFGYSRLDYEDISEGDIFSLFYGSYKDSQSEINFALPEKIINALNELRGGSSSSNNEPELQTQ